MFIKKYLYLIADLEFSIKMISTVIIAVEVSMFISNRTIFTYLFINLTVL
jgi:hypothetical protein